MTLKDLAASLGVSVYKAYIMHIENTAKLEKQPCNSEVTKMKSSTTPGV